MAINSKYQNITNHTQLLHTIMHVNAARVDQEEEIKYQFKELYYTFQPATLLKNALQDPETQKSIAQVALSLGTDFLISKFLRKGNSLKGFVSAIVVEKIADLAINSKSEFINNGINKLTGLFKKFTS